MIDRLADGAWAPRLVLCNVSVATYSFADVVRAAVAGGFDALSLLGTTYRRATEREGLSARDMRQMLDDHGLELTDVEAVGDWLGHTPTDLPRWLSAVYSAETYLEIAAELGAATVVAVHFGAPATIDHAAERFAELSARAAERGLAIALEYPAFATIHDLETTAEIVSRAGRTNGGIVFDTWHHRRGGSDAQNLSKLDGAQVFSVQLADGARQPVGSLLEDVQHRAMPGTGELDLVELVRELDARGVRAPVGIEVFDSGVLAKGPEFAAQRLGDSLRELLAEALG
jgi:sugar phosphate isomerase/epimerase